LLLSAGTLGCGRRADVLKFYLAWIYHGSDGFMRRVDTALTNAQLVIELSKCHPSIVLAAEPSFVNICFWVIPPKDHFRLIGLQQTNIKEFVREVSDLTQRQHANMMARLRFMVDFAPLNLHGGSSGEVALVWRLVIQHPKLTPNDMHKLIDELLKCAT
jgi:glutamate/tyrosine decarboxylase-like PLP-dependent enzyme